MTGKDGNDPLSRRDLLRGRFLGKLADVAADRFEQASGAFEQTPVSRRRDLPLTVFRPPGAIEESAFLEACTRCGECIDVCPVDAIKLAPTRMRQAAGTPILDPHETACVMCEDTPCITACEPLALRGDAPIKMGEARVQQPDCLAYMGTTCTVCAERCPVEGAIALDRGKPVIDPQRCTGCGVCHDVCPAPVNAIIVLPEPTRPAP